MLAKVLVATSFAPPTPPHLHRPDPAPTCGKPPKCVMALRCCCCCLAHPETFWGIEPCRFFKAPRSHRRPTLSPLPLPLPKSPPARPLPSSCVAVSSSFSPSRPRRRRLPSPSSCVCVSSCSCPLAGNKNREQVTIHSRSTERVDAV